MNPTDRSRSVASRFHQLLRGLRTVPSRRDIVFAALVTGGYFILTGAIGFGSGLLRPSIAPLTPGLIAAVPLLLFIFPSIPEEVVFRGLLLPHRGSAPSRKRMVVETAISTTLFVVWHPFNAATINPSAYAIFTDPRFLVLVVLLGLTCAITYLRSGSLWIPIVIHWLTILPWVLLLGGRNELLRRLQG